MIDAAEGTVPPPPEGSPAYYGVLFCPSDRRPVLVALLALARELERITASVGEASIAMIRLNWWVEELERLATGEPRHPITQTLQAAVDAVDPQPLQHMALISKRLCTESGQTVNERVELDCQRSSAVYGFTAAWLAGPDRTDQDQARPAGGRIGAGVRLAQVATDDPDIAVTGFGDHAVMSLRQGLADIPANLRASQTPLIVISTLYLNRLRRSGPGQTQAGRCRHAMASLSMIMTAWRAARAASRGRLTSIAGSRGA